MKLGLKLLFGCLLLVTLVFSVNRGMSAYKAHKKRVARRAVIPVTEQKQFVIIIPSYNNSAYCEWNLRSVFNQKYDNYRVIYIDDCSKDNTFGKAKEVIETMGQTARTTLIRNEKNQGALANLYHAIHSCKDSEIIVTVDGDDALAHNEVLIKLNQVYANPDVWMTYGNFLNYPTYTKKPVTCKKFPKKVISNNSYRSQEWVSSHLRTFYAGLFKQVKLEHLLYEGHFLPMGWDLGFLFPMLEMSGPHAHFISDILYLYNRANPLNDHKVNFALQDACGNHVRKLRHYDRLKALPLGDEIKGEKVDILVYSCNRPLQLYAFLESVEHYCTNFNRVYVLCRIDNEGFAKGYEKVKTRFPFATFVTQSSKPKEDFRPLFLNTIFDKSLSSSPYITFASDDSVVKDFIDFKDCTRLMEETGALGFYLTYGTHVTHCYMLDCEQGIPPTIPVAKGVYAWQFKQGRADWKYPNSNDMVVYRKEDLKPIFNKLEFCNPNTLESEWNLKGNLRRVGLFYERSKVVILPLNLVNISSNKHSDSFSVQDLLEKFEAGLKMDITPLSDIENASRHIDYTPTFIPQAQPAESG